MSMAPKPKHMEQDLANNGQILNKRRRKHIKEGLYTKVSATLQESRRAEQLSGYRWLWVLVALVSRGLESSWILLQICVAFLACG